MKREFTVKVMVAGLALAVSMWTGRAIAGEQFKTLEGIPADAISHRGMAAVEGKASPLDLLSGLGSANGLLLIPTQLLGGGTGFLALPLSLVGGTGSPLTLLSGTGSPLALLGGTGGGGLNLWNLLNLHIPGLLGTPGQLANVKVGK